MAKQLRIAVVGKTGNGKSSVANSIIGKKDFFKTGLSPNRVTKVTSSRTKRWYSGHTIEVFDTPGLYQEGEDEYEIRKEIEKITVSPGLHAVVFVIKSGCFTKEEQEAVEQMKTLFGTSIFRFTIFAFTCINDLGMQSIEGFVNESASVYLEDVIRRSGSRVVGFDNRDKTKDQESVKKIISLVADMSHTNKECLYSRVLFEEAFQAKMKRKKEEQEKKEIERRLEFEKATAEKEAALKKKHEEDRNTKAKRQDQITSEQQQYLQETAEKEKLSIERVNRESLKEIEEKLQSGTNDLIADTNLKTGVALDTQPEAKGHLQDSTDPQHFKGENQPTIVECFVAKGKETAFETKASVTMNVAGRDARDTESQTAFEQSLERRSDNIEREPESYGILPNELRLVIIGKSGNGKSSTANTIIGKDQFKTGASATSITKKTDRCQASRFGKEILLVDTPGLFDPEIEQKVTEKEIARCVSMTLPGFHAFLLVVRIGRFTAEEMNTVKEFEKLFGEELYDFMIIVFTRTDDLLREGKTLGEFVRCNIPPTLKQIIERCSHRYVGLNNIDSPENKEKVSKELVEMVERMIASKDPNHYSNEAFEKAEKELCEAIKAATKAKLETMFAEKENKMREEQDIKITEMKNAWDKERKEQEKEAKRTLEAEREMMESRFTVKINAMLENETKVREALLNQQREDSERAIQEIIDRKEERVEEVSTRFDNERSSREKEHENTITNLSQHYETRFTDQKMRFEAEHKLYIERDARMEETRKKSTWFRVGMWLGFHD